MKRTPVRRSWAEARAKVDDEGGCRVAGLVCAGVVQAAHVIGRANDPLIDPDKPAKGLYAPAIDIVPLCRAHHARYDRHELDLLPYLTPEEQTRAVAVAGGIAAALRRISGR